MPPPVNTTPPVTTSADPREAVSHRPVRSFVLRAGRMTVAQQRALEALWPLYGIDFRAAPLDFGQVFGRQAPRVMEIGFGDGELLTELARQNPGTDFLGVEVHEPGVGHCLLLIEKHGLTNVRVIRHDAIEVLHEQIPAASLQELKLLFPDPWPKKRHHKRRIVQASFVSLVASRLAPGGLFHIATDWAPYAEHISAVLNAEPAFVPQPPGSARRPSTRFERRGERLGHEVFERVWQRSTPPAG